MHQVFGIRHHGPGSARSLLAALTAMQPDIVLVEGPPDANLLLPLLAHEQMQPPVALLVYVEEKPKQAVFYPFAEFSPEFQAIRFALAATLPVRFIDLPQAQQLAMIEEISAPVTLTPIDSDTSLFQPPPDPFGWIAQASGYADGERWWEHLVEQRRAAADLFVAIHSIMQELRQESDQQRFQSGDPLNLLREASMRQAIRQAEKDGFQRIAVVCGAWHTPALIDLATTRTDAELLKGLPKVKVAATWTPWTQGRLTYASGYGAGITSPGWYAHLWQASGKEETPQKTVIGWMTLVARLLRQQDLDASSASVIEAVRLAETLAALRRRALPDLVEMNEAARTIFCFGDDLPMRLVHERLIVGEQIGTVPDSVPSTPFQRDLLATQRRLRLALEALSKTLDLDLRTPFDLERSHLLHRLNLLAIGWGVLQKTSGKGTFRETWQMAWQPEFAVRIVEASLWGSSVADAATAFARAMAVGVDVKGAQTASSTLVTLSNLLDVTLLADLPAAVAMIMLQLQTQAATTSDVAQLMDALPALANIARYGNVRQTDSQSVRLVAQGFITRICVGLPTACAALNDAAAGEMLPRINATHSAVELMQEEMWTMQWLATLRKLVDQAGLHGLLAGRCCRILLDRQLFDSDECARRMWLAFSTANDPLQSAAWVEGLLDGSGLLLIHDERLWQVVDSWLSAINTDHFTQALPLLRRSFSRFPAPERRQMGEMVKNGKATTVVASDLQAIDFDSERALATLPLLAQILGLRD